MFEGFMQINETPESVAARMSQTGKTPEEMMSYLLFAEPDELSEEDIKENNS